MQVVVIANAAMQKEFESKGMPAGIEVYFETAFSQAKIGADVYFYLLPEQQLTRDINGIAALNKPVFVHAVIRQLSALPANALRINAWKGFLQRPIIEIAAGEQNTEHAATIMERLQWHYQLVPDIVGMITARVISMIVNEAYFALQDEISTKEEIDIAMKLGTNYPYGPFEWSEIIGLENIKELLTKLSENDNRYLPAPLLIKETN